MQISPKCNDENTFKQVCVTESMPQHKSVMYEHFKLAIHKARLSFISQQANTIFDVQNNFGRIVSCRVELCHDDPDGNFVNIWPCDGPTTSHRVSISRGMFNISSSFLYIIGI